MSDYAVFSAEDFDPNEYANAILAGESFPASQTQQLSSTSHITPGSSTLAYSSAKSTAENVPLAKEDISVAISKLTFGIDDVSKQIKTLVTTHHEDLLSQAASGNALSGSLTAVRSGLKELDHSMEKLLNKLHTPFNALQMHAKRLQKLQQASDVLRRTSRFVILARRLRLLMDEMGDGTDGSANSATKAEEEGKHAPNLITNSLSTSSNQIPEGEDEKERTIARAALSIAELTALLEGPAATYDSSILTAPYHDTLPDRTTISDTGLNSLEEPPVQKAIPLRSIKAVSSHIQFIEDARTRVTSEMQNMVLTGLMTLDQSLLASSLQTAYNLGVLPELVQGLILDLSQAVDERIRNAFDLSRISKDATSKDPVTSSSQQSPTMYRSRVRTEPTNITAPQWTAALWNRLESMIEEMAGCCDKVYTLEKVLKLKKDAVSQVVFLDEAMKLLDNKPSSTFWTSLSRSLEKHAREAAKSSSFLQQTLSNGYPRLLRLFHEYFAKIAVHTDTVYIHTYQSPETVLILRALANFESLYLSRSSNKLNEAVGQAFSGGSRNPPGMNEGVNIARTMVNELDSARFDPLLVKSVAKNVAASLDMVLSRMDGLIVRDRSAVTLIGPSATPQQLTNIQSATCIYQCLSRLEKLETEYTEGVYAVLKPSIENMRRAFDNIVDPLLTAIRRELGAIIARLHRVDLGKPIDPMAGLGGASLYMKDLVDKLSFIKAEILSLFNVPDISRTWLTSVVQYVIRTFVLHVSIAKPLGETGKLQLTSDMTELEFALSSFMADGPQSKRGGDLESVGNDYRMLRAMRPLLFLDNAQLASPKHTAGLPPLIVLHHILVRSPIPLPHSLHGWQEAEYVRWVDEHSEEEAWTLVEGGLSHWEKISESEGQDPEGALEYIQLARTVLANAQQVI